MLKFAGFEPFAIFAAIKNSKNTSTMKKVFAILAVAGFMAACNSGENKAAATDSAATTVDTAAKAAMDTTAVAADTTKAAADTTKK